MDRHSGRLVEQLHTAQARHRKVIQQLQVDSARCLKDLCDIRHERDTFRKEAARMRKENAELQNRVEELLTECQDLKREKAGLARALVAGGHAGAQGHVRSALLGLKLSNTLSILNEEGPTSPETSESGTTPNAEQVSFQELEAYLQRDLPDPPKSDPPLPDCSAGQVVSPVHDDAQGGQPRQTPACRGDSPLLPGNSTPVGSGRARPKVATVFSTSR